MGKEQKTIRLAIHSRSVYWKTVVVFWIACESFDGQSVSTFYPTIEVVFEIKNTNERYHLPVLVSPFGYSTYRGS